MLLCVSVSDPERGRKDPSYMGHGEVVGPFVSYPGTPDIEIIQGMIRQVCTVSLQRDSLRITHIPTGYIVKEWYLRVDTSEARLPVHVSNKPFILPKKKPFGWGRVKDLCALVFVGLFVSLCVYAFNAFSAFVQGR